jgi:hypothetical protein
MAKGNVASILKQCTQHILKQATIAKLSLFVFVSYLLCQFCSTSESSPACYSFSDNSCRVVGEAMHSCQRSRIALSVAAISARTF